MIRLLLVDDEAFIREGILCMVDWARLGIEVTGAAENALSALESMMDDMPDILLTDIKMPGMDGLELVERALQLNPALQCVILSGYDEFAYAQRALHMGVREYLLKLCNKEDMEEVLGRICERLRAERHKAHNEQATRHAQVLLLTERLLQLRPAGSGDAVIQPEQVRGLTESLGNAVLLREAYVLLLAQQERARLTAAEAVQDVYRDMAEDVLFAQTAHALTALLPASAPRRAFVSKMVACIHRQYADPRLSLQYLADHEVHMNADYIGKEFARDMGMKLSAYLLQVRMERAKQLLQEAEDYRMYEIAERVGLGHNPNYFSRLFYKQEGITPKEYRTRLFQQNSSEI